MFHFAVLIFLFLLSALCCVPFRCSHIFVPVIRSLLCSISLFTCFCSCFLLSVVFHFAFLLLLFLFSALCCVPFRLSLLFVPVFRSLLCSISLFSSFYLLLFLRSLLCSISPFSSFFSWFSLSVVFHFAFLLLLFLFLALCCVPFRFVPFRCVSSFLDFATFRWGVTPRIVVRSPISGAPAPLRGSFHSEGGHPGWGGDCTRFCPPKLPFSLLALAARHLRERAAKRQKRWLSPETCGDACDAS